MIHSDSSLSGWQIRHGRYFKSDLVVMWLGDPLRRLQSCTRADQYRMLAVLIYLILVFTIGSLPIVIDDSLPVYYQNDNAPGYSPVRVA